jgi:peptidyl-prolyl cis-trans isomerase SurA
VVATIQDQPVLLKELTRGYTGSIDNDSVSTVELRNFLPSFVDYRLKILEGKQRGYFNDPDIQTEYKTYAKQAAKKLWMSSEVESRILETFIQRSQKELLAYHILITAENPDYQEANEIKNKLENARIELLEGTNPDSVNVNYSSTQNGNYAGGSLPWITAGRTVKNFEDVLYSLEPGEVSRPFQTQFGFHIIYLMEERPRTPEKFTRHIFVSKQSEENPTQKISAALDSLNQKIEWNTVVSKFSEDRRTATRGGEIGWVGYGMQFPEPFVNAVMTTSDEDDFSDIVEMDYGFHILRVDSVRNLQNRQALEEYATNELEKLGRLQPGDEELFEMLKEYGNFDIFEEEFTPVANYLSGNTGTFNPDAEIAEFNKKRVTADQFVQYYEQEISQGSEETMSIEMALE